ncbi:spermidine synthase [Klenkia marina]|uniref:spermidine synthase n=1 Tax=Klenkia marina TaxID=1960309 RepID=UPI001A9EED4B|nr:spermidine synthase [Klenkia marina]
MSGPHGEVALWRRTADDGAAVTELVVDGVFAMDDVDTSTERALATEALARVDGAELAVLVGGLGLGWTAASVLASPGVAEVVVVELEDALLRWAATGLLPGLPSISDPRLDLVAGDVACAFEPDRYDAVLLDVDNGPDFLVHGTNAGLYGAPGLARALAAVRPGGVLAIWSADPSPTLLARLAQLPDAVDAEQLVLPVERDGRVFEYAVLLVRRN